MYLKHLKPNCNGNDNYLAPLTTP